MNLRCTILIPFPGLQQPYGNILTLSSLPTPFPKKSTNQIYRKRYDDNFLWSWKVHLTASACCASKNYCEWWIISFVNFETIHVEKASWTGKESDIKPWKHSPAYRYISSALSYSKYNIKIIWYISNHAISTCFWRWRRTSVGFI